MTTPTSAAWGSSEEPLTVARKAGLHGMRWTAWLAGATGLAQLVSTGLNFTDTVRGVAPATYPTVDVVSSVVALVLLVSLLVGRPNGPAMLSGLALLMAMLMAPTLHKHAPESLWLAAAHAVAVVAVIMLSVMTSRFSSAELDRP
ncbi:hypothetical protein [Rhodococcus sp. (in: high G+C Gram-positive bacteria)]|uniref:hypothetical protein n=1 Tax=Rhodococcus sp. TaxID=1831 RepID=UPI001A2C3D97|nr:hypothetical protein [Rhodococcus sp. (in: high G+C Gram-positive bacteria)]MBJ7478827.1 hypothetical protein [Rhodococcus sp. (in: high G+C Gram-positive bacteria)]